MTFVYRIIINIILFLSPLILIYRLIIKKEDLKRFKEKFCFFSKSRSKGKIIWFHGASVGELQSIIPLLEKLNKVRNIKQILVTSNTLSSANIIQKIKLKKVVHQFFPIDTNYHVKKFLDFWEPSSAFFIDSEIWPNMFLNLKKRNIPIILLNGRITKKSYLRWKFFSNFSKEIFKNFNLCLTSNKETIKYLNELGVKNIKFLGNLKYSQSENENVNLNNSLEKFLLSKKTWCASSTHFNEEIFCGEVHKKLKKKYKNLLTIIIPRHINRADEIKNDFKKLKLKIHMHESKLRPKDDIDIYIVNSYGKTKSFFNYCKNVFLGGSLISHGGQNPLEAARYGCNIIHGPHIQNFKEIYDFLKKNKISQKINNEKQILNLLNKNFSKIENTKIIQKKLDYIGQKILKNTLKEIKIILKNEI